MAYVPKRSEMKISKNDVTIKAEKILKRVHQTRNEDAAKLAVDALAKRYRSDPAAVAFCRRLKHEMLETAASVYYAQLLGGTGFGVRRFEFRGETRYGVDVPGGR